MKKDIKEIFLRISLVFVLFIIIILLEYNFIDFITTDFNSYTESLFTPDELRMDYFGSFFRTMYNSQALMQYISIISIIFIIMISNRQIIRKERYYVYFIGRNQRFLEKYYGDTVKMAIKYFFCYWIPFLIIITISVIYSNDLSTYEEFYGKDTILSIFAKNDILKIISLIIIQQIPIFLFIIIGSLLIITSQFFIKNKIILFSSVIVFLFIVSSLLNTFDLFVISPIYSVSYRVLDINLSYIYAILNLCFFTLILFIGYRKVVKHDKF